VFSITRGREEGTHFTTFIFISCALPLLINNSEVCMDRILRMTILKGNGKETAMRRHGISTVHTEWKVTQSFVAQDHWCYSVEPFRVEGGELTMAIKTLLPC
jgi:hypothetical protein